MKVSFISQLGQRARANWLPLLLSAIFIASFGAPAARAQNDQRRSLPSSELSRQNDTHVAASAIDLKSVFLRDPGLMVEIKRWMAKDATDHGQLVTDNDLTDDAVYDRIENDVEFRSVCTKLVQKYGYLVPKLNPESDQAKEHDLLVQERVKWTAQEDEEARARGRQEAADQMKATERAQHCELNTGEAACNPVPASQSGNPSQPSANPPAQGPDRTSPQPNRQAPPSQTPSTQQAQLQTTGYENDAYDVPLGSSDQGMGGAGGASGGGQRIGGAGGLYGGMRGQSAPMEGAGGPSGVYSSEWATNDLGQWDTNSESQQNNVYNYTSAPNSQPNAAGARPSAAQPEMVRQRSPYQDIPSLYDMYMQAL